MATVAPAPPATPPSRAQLIHIEVDRRLGHEWDEWNGKPLPGGGDFSAPPGLFFRYAALTLALSSAVVAFFSISSAHAWPGFHPPCRGPCGSCSARRSP